MNDLIPANFGAVSSRFQGVQVNDDLSSGIQSSFGLIGYKGKVWSIRYRGEEKTLMRADNDGPMNSIETVILNASEFVSKIWYENGYTEGSVAAPDCFSNNGIAPEPTSAKPQHTSCALCPHNQWGSRITPAGKQGKSCADSKRLAVVPSQDIENTVYGGPMLLRVPAASLQDLAMYGQKMQQMGYPYFSIATKISFDPAEAYPKFQFSGIRPLTDAEADLVMSMRDGHQVQRILSESEFGTTAAPTPADDGKPLFEQSDAGPKSVGDQARAAAAQQAANHGATQPQQTVKPVEAVKPVEPVTTQVTETPEQMEARIKAEIEKRIQEEYAAKAKAQTQATSQSVQEPQKTEAAPTQQASGFGGTVAEAKPAEQVQPTQQAEAPGVATPSDFELDLDNMLSGLLKT